MSNISPEPAVLGFLLDGPIHGYDLHRNFQLELGMVWRLSQSQAYAILKRLEVRGDITTENAGQEKLPKRQVLRITPSGRKRFGDWLDDTSSNARAIRLEFLTRLYFTRKLHPERIPRLFSMQNEEIRVNMERLESIMANLSNDQIINLMSLDLRLRQLKVIQAWLDDVQASLNTRGKIP